MEVRPVGVVAKERPEVGDEAEFRTIADGGGGLGTDGSRKVKVVVSKNRRVVLGCTSVKGVLKFW